MIVYHRQIQLRSLATIVIAECDCMKPLRLRLEHA